MTWGRRGWVGIGEEIHVEELVDGGGVRVGHRGCVVLGWGDRRYAQRVVVDEGDQIPSFGFQDPVARWARSSRRAPSSEVTIGVDGHGGGVHPRDDERSAPLGDPTLESLGMRRSRAQFEDVGRLRLGLATGWSIGSFHSQYVGIDAVDVRHTSTRPSSGRPLSTRRPRWWCTSLDPSDACVYHRIDDNSRHWTTLSRRVLCTTGSTSDSTCQPRPPPL